jgi:tRNA (uracil-5-)-methyltransferase TRM9
VNFTTIDRLLNVNKSFYQTFAEQFSATRRRLQPGVQRILEKIDPEAHILDLGCGNGELARNLSCSGHCGLYVGIDLSSKLLEQASEKISRMANCPTHFIQADLSDPGWEIGLPTSDYDLILAFAVLHHLPGASLRRSVLSTVNQLLKPNGHFIHSEWQFLNSPRLQARIQPWEKIGLSDDQVENGDYLLDWRHGGLGYRYVHNFSIGELTSLARETGFTILESFSSDGENGKLGLYQVWERKST